ncbi:MAG TPA: Uma2 family endonuclease [Planctomycetota bacterium]|nr:Uma2 family endonuclease [Planctomycetota bacterium]
MGKRSIVSEQRAPYGLRVARRPKSSVPPDPEIPPLENGDNLDSVEFMRRYEAMPNLKKAELIQGVVYIMSSPLHVMRHATPDNIMQGQMHIYAAESPGVDVHANPTVQFGPEDTPQPDSVMRLLPEFGGKSSVTDDDYIAGSPEMVVEIAASSASYDLNQKKESYLKYGVLEYVAWRTRDKALSWFYLENGEYCELLADKDGIIRSRVFPGFWIDVAALMKRDRARLKAMLERGLKSAEHAAFLRAHKS